MNMSSTSTFLNYCDNSSSGSESSLQSRSSQIIFFENGNVLMPNNRTQFAIKESEMAVGRFDSIEDFFDNLND